MATITKVCRKSGNAYKAVIRLRGIKPFSKTFKLRKDAKAWAERRERNIDEARAHGNDRVRTLTLKELVRAYERHFSGKNLSAIFCLSWWVGEIGDMRLFLPFTHKPQQDNTHIIHHQSMNIRHTYTEMPYNPAIVVGAPGADHFFDPGNPCGKKTHPY
jgi:hypothetical protein